MITDRAHELLDALRAEILAMRIDLAWRRDSMLTEAEHMAMLEVYGEFGW